MMKRVWLNGCFDVLHRGHIEMVKYAREVGDYVVVGTDTDARINESKGNTRPINTLEDRIEILRSIKYIDHVVSFDSDEELIDHLKFYKPDHRILGSEYKNSGKIVGEDFSGDILFFDRIEQYSSTDTIKEMNKK